MERRWSKRRPIVMGVKMYFQDDEVYVGSTRDISYDGVRIDMDQSKIPPNGFISMEFDSVEEGKVKIGGSIVHVGGNGVGVMFSDYDLRAFRFLQKMMLP